MNLVQFISDRVEQELLMAYFLESDDDDGHEVRVNSGTCYPSCNDLMYSSQVFYSNVKRDANQEDVKTYVINQIIVFLVNIG